LVNLTQDYAGKTVRNPPEIGAYELLTFWSKIIDPIIEPIWEAVIEKTIE